MCAEDPALFQLVTHEDGRTVLGQRATRETVDRLHKQHVAQTGQRARALSDVKFSDEVKAPVYAIYNAVQEQGGIVKVSMPLARCSATREQGFAVA